MKVALIGRSRWLLNSGKALLTEGHSIVLVATAPAERFYRCEPAEFEAFARKIDADFFCGGRINGDEGLHRICAASADIAVSVNWPTLIGADTISAISRGILNAHCGDLPRFRGNACPNWAILAGEPYVGLCVHEMKPGELDSGPVLRRDRLPLSDDTYIGDIYDWLDERIPKLFVEAVDGLITGRLSPEPQMEDPSLSLRCFPRRPEDARIDWHDEVRSIHRLVRASSHPFSGAFTTLEGDTRITVWRAEPHVFPTPFLAVPGQVIGHVQGDPLIACGDGVLRLTAVALEGVSGSDAAKREIGRSLRRRLI